MSDSSAAIRLILYMTKKLTEAQKAVLETLRELGRGSNDFHLAVELGAPRDEICELLEELESRGLVETFESRSRMPCGGNETFVVACLVDDSDNEESP